MVSTSHIRSLMRWIAAFSLLFFFVSTAFGVNINYRVRDSQDLFTYLVRIEAIPERDLPEEEQEPGTILLRVAYDDSYKKSAPGQRFRVWRDLKFVPQADGSLAIYTRHLFTEIFRGRIATGQIAGERTWSLQRTELGFYKQILKIMHSLKEE